MISKRINVSDRIYQIVKQDILDDVLDFGDTIIEQEFADRLNISRTPIREAFKRLEVEGILTRLPNGRIKIIEIDDALVREIYHIRISLENVILENILENENNCTSEFINKLQKIVDVNEREIQNQEWEDARKSITTFSKEMLASSNYTVSSKILDQYNFFLSKLKIKSLASTERIKQAYNDHKEMLELIKSRDILQLQKVNKRHLMTACQTIIHQMSESKK
ncbi:MAG: hypothetical protein ATN35_01595 [Epulopiscium sp. Nele67-Bin004]|nr:MAG: hypothetical protein ATN35_01595 [Epulopiscium sp. Nele67-Bin004]